MANTTNEKAIEDLKKENQELKELLNKLMKNINDTAEKSKINNNDNDDASSLLNKQIKVTSTYNGMLNLKEFDNQGVKFKFNKIGESKNILYSSLINIVSWKPSLAQNGYYYIEDEKAVKYLELFDYYKNLLSYQDMKNIGSKTEKELEDILPRIPDVQKRTLTYVILSDMHDKKISDFNKIRKVGELIGVDIVNIYNNEYEKYYNVN